MNLDTARASVVVANDNNKVDDTIEFRRMKSGGDLLSVVDFRHY